MSISASITESVAKALQTDGAELEKIAGKKNGVLDFEKLSQHESFKGRVLTCNPADFQLPKKFGDTRPWPSAHRLFFIDNGDGKIGRGDIYIREYDSKFAFAVALIGLFPPADIKLASKSGTVRKEINWNIVPEIKRTVKQIEARKGWPIQDLNPLLKERCRELLNLPDLPKNKSLKDEYDSFSFPW